MIAANEFVDAAFKPLENFCMVLMAAPLIIAIAIMVNAMWPDIRNYIKSKL